MATGNELDVYAEPYIPLILKQVNSAPAHFYSSQEPPWINFDSYVLDFAGRFLTARPRPSIAISPPQDTGPLALNANTYSPFFSAALDLEISALQNECEQRNLYQVGLFQMVSGVPCQHTLYGLLECFLSLVKDEPCVQGYTEDAAHSMPINSPSPQPHSARYCSELQSEILICVSPAMFSKPYIDY